jgi:hypothetical protein
MEGMRGLWHPVRAQILKLLKPGPAHRSWLIAKVDAPPAEVAYHCRALCAAGCIQLADPSGPGAGDPTYEAL